jgi:parvulin-like peptidyl-prolyl isomerase
VEQKEEIKKKVEALREDIDSKKISFEEAATKNSQDEASAAKGGDLGFFPRGKLVKPFEDFAFSAKPGILSPVVETQFGFHLISVAENKPAGKMALEEVKDKIQGFLGQKSKEENLKKHIGDLRAKVKVESVMTEDDWKARRAPK